MKLVVKNAKGKIIQKAIQIEISCSASEYRLSWLQMRNSFTCSKAVGDNYGCTRANGHKGRCIAGITVPYIVIITSEDSE